MDRKTLVLFFVLGCLTAFASACSGESDSACQQFDSSTPVAAEDMTDDCLHEAFGNAFIVPDLSDRYRMVGYGLESAATDDLIVIFYEPLEEGQPLLRMEVNFRPESYPGGIRMLNLSGDETLYVTDRGDVALGNVKAGQTVYALALGTAGDNGVESDESLVWIAESILRQAAS